MIKPIVYPWLQRKRELEKELMAQIPYEKGKAVAKELIDRYLAIWLIFPLKFASYV